MSSSTEWWGPAGIAAGFSAWGQAEGWLRMHHVGRGVVRGGVGKINTVCLLFSLSAYLTLFAGIWLYWTQQLSIKGEPVSDFAKLAFLLAGESIDFERELAVISGVLSIIVIPQLFNYVIAGLFGAAGGTKFGAWCLRVVFWTTLKGFAIAGGVSVAWGAMAAYLNWPHAYQNSPFPAIGMGFSQISLSVIGTTMAGTLENSSLAVLRARIKRVLRPLMPIHQWMTRYKNPPIDLSRY